MVPNQRECSQRYLRLHKQLLLSILQIYCSLEIVLIGDIFGNNVKLNQACPSYRRHLPRSLQKLAGQNLS